MLKNKLNSLNSPNGKGEFVNKIILLRKFNKLVLNMHMLISLVQFLAQLEEKKNLLKILSNQNSVISASHTCPSTV